MNRKFVMILALASALVLALGLVMAASAVSGAAFTTYNPWVDGLFKEVCKNSIINCNIYGSKPDVWLNGGPAANGLGPDGDYFFAVLVPGGQPNPNDGGPKNLSDDYDTVADRTFTVKDGEVFSYDGPHDLDSGNTLDPNRSYCHKPRGCPPDGEPPLIRLYPFADTWNPGGVYILAICSLEEGYPVEPRDCKYDAFKVKEVFTAVLRLSGIKFEDLYADGKADWDWPDFVDPGLPDWYIKIDGNGLLGEEIHEVVKTGEGGYWEFEKEYSYNKFTPLVPAHLTVCEILQEGWTQSYPDPACYDFWLEPAALAEKDELDFGNWYPAKKSGVKFEDLDADGKAREVGEPGLKGWTIFVDYDGDTALDADEPSALTGDDGAYTITGIKPGTWTVREVLKEGWTCSFPNPCSYTHTFYSRASFPGNDFGNWYPAKKGGYKWYDRDADGAWDADEPTIPGWKIEVYDANGALVAWEVTDANGYYEFDLKPGTYTVKEVCPSAGGWHQSWPAPVDGCGSGTYVVTLVSRQVDTNNHFGNYCVGYADFGTKGYWHNKNGLGELYADPGFPALLAYINSLDPYDDASGYFNNGEEPFDGYDGNGDPVPPAIDALNEFGLVFNEISQFLVDPNAGGDPREQLAQQLLAFIFNANYRLDDPAATVWVNGSWVSAESLIEQAVAIWTSGSPAEQNAMQELLNSLNESDYLPFIHYNPCTLCY